MNIESSGSALKFIFRALRHKNYRLFFCGQSISLIGTWMQTIAASWLVYRLTNSAFLLGLVGFLGQLPIFIVAPFSGVIADHFDRKRILLATQILAMLQALALAFLFFSGLIKVWHIMFLSAFLGIVNAFDVPTRQSFVVEMVDNKEDLANAIALNSSMVNSARLIGPSIAGIIIAVMKEGVCFLINGISYLAAIAALLKMRIKRRESGPEVFDIFSKLKEGFVYVFGHAAIRYILMLLVIISLMGISCVVLMPIFAKEILKGGSSLLGFLMASIGLGAMAGTFHLAQRKNMQGLESDIFKAAWIFAVSLIVFSFSRNIFLSLLIMFSAGFGMIVQVAASNTILQFLTSDDKRGRVMSFYSMAFMGMSPFGSLLAGSLASKIGAPHTLFISGIVCALGIILLSAKANIIEKSLRSISSV